MTWLQAWLGEATSWLGIAAFSASTETSLAGAGFPRAGLIVGAIGAGRGGVGAFITKKEGCLLMGSAEGLVSSNTRQIADLGRDPPLVRVPLEAQREVDRLERLARWVLAPPHRSEGGPSRPRQSAVTIAVRIRD